MVESKTLRCTGPVTVKQPNANVLCLNFSKRGAVHYGPASPFWSKNEVRPKLGSYLEPTESKM